MPPVFGPVSPSPTRLWSWAEASAHGGLAVDQREQARFLALEEFLDHQRAVAGGVDRRLGFGAGHGDRHALAGGEPVGLDHDRDPEAVERGVRIRHASRPGHNRRSGCRCARHKSLVKPFEPSSWAAAALGPNTANAGRAQRIGDAGDQRRFGTDDDQVDRVALAPARRPRPRSQGSIATHSAQRAMPGLPGAAISSPQLGDCLSRQASASSRPPDPNSRIFMDLPDDTRAGLLANVAPGDNSPPLSVSELSGALKRTIENAFGQVRVRGEISGFKRHASGHCYFTLKDENACIDAVIWRGQRGRARLPARGRRRGHRHRQAHHLSRAAPNIRSSSSGWSWRARARCWRCSSGGARRSPPKGCSTPRASASCRSCRESSASSPRRPAR